MFCVQKFVLYVMTVCYLLVVMYFHFVVASQDNISLFAFLSLFIPAGEFSTSLVQHLLWIIVRL